MSALVLAALVVMWAVVLVPMFLRRHDRAHELASADRFAGAMRVLSRRRSTGRGPMAAEERAAAIAEAFGAPHAGSPTAPQPTDQLPQDAPQDASQQLSHEISQPVSQQLSQQPTQHERAVARTMAANRSVDRTARVAARRRGLMLMVALVVCSVLLAAVLGGWWVWLQVVVDLLALAGLAQLRATALADRARGPVRRPSNLPVPQAFPSMLLETPVGAGVGAGVDLAVEEPVVRPRRAARQVVFDAVSEMPIVSRPRLRPARPSAGPVAPAAAGRRDDATAPPEADSVPLPLLDGAEADPETLTSGLELEALRRASGE